MVMFRDWGVCWLLSIGFEVRLPRLGWAFCAVYVHAYLTSSPFLSCTWQVLECSLQFIIPEFKECWWDSLLIDLLGAAFFLAPDTNQPIKSVGSRT
jgi:hypothetical protein